MIGPDGLVEAACAVCGSLEGLVQDPIGNLAGAVASLVVGAAAIAGTVAGGIIRTGQTANTTFWTNLEHERIHDSRNLYRPGGEAHWDYDRTAQEWKDSGLDPADLQIDPPVKGDSSPETHAEWWRGPPNWAPQPPP